MIVELATALAIMCPHIPKHELVGDATNIVAFAVAYDFEPSLIAAIVVRESTCRRDAENLDGNSHGLMGIRNATELERADYIQNLRTGVKLLAFYRSKCADVHGFVSAYHDGRGVGNRNCRRTPYSEQVLAIRERLIKQQGEREP